MGFNLSFNLRQRVWLLLSGAVLGAALAFVLAFSQPSQFRAQAAILLQFPGGAGDWDRAAATYVQLARSPEVRQAAVQSLSQSSGSTLTPDMLTGMSSIAPIPDSQLLAIDVTASDPLQAQTLANALAQQLLAATQRLLANPEADGLRKQLADLQTQLDAARADWTSLDNQITAAHDPASLTDLRARRNDVIDHYLLLQANLAALTTQYNQLTRGTPSLSLFEPAGDAETNSATASPVAAALLGLIIGAIGGGTLGLWLENADGTWRTASAIRRSLDLPTLATIPSIRARPGEEKLIVYAEPSYAEPYRALAVALGLPNGAAGQAVGITSPGADEGKSLTAANLGLTLAQAGRRTLILDADLRTPTQHRLFKISNRDGLTGLLHEFSLRADAQGDDEALADLLPVSPAIKRLEIGSLSLLTSGPLPARPEDVHGSAYLPRLIRALGAHFEIVLIDLPPVLTGSAVQALAPCLDATLLVIDAQRTRRQATRRAIRVLNTAGARLSGAALNRARIGRNERDDSDQPAARRATSV